MISAHHPWNKKLTPLVTGFILSLFLTFAGYFFATQRPFSPLILTVLILGLAFLQALSQILYFFQVSAEASPRWGLITLLFTVLVLLIVVLGSLWIMANLNYNMMEM